MKRKRLKSILACMLVLSMVFGVQSAAFAAETGDTVVQKEGTDDTTDTTDVTDKMDDTEDKDTTGKNDVDADTEGETIEPNSGIAPASAEDDAVNVITSEGGSLTAGTYTLSENVTLSTNLTIPASIEVTIDLNGYTLTGSGNGNVITVEGMLILKDSTAITKNIDFSSLPTEVFSDSVFTAKSIANQNGGYITYYSDVSETMTTTYYSYMSGAITGGNNTNHGGGVVVTESGKLIMENGTIADNVANGKAGGGIKNDGQLIMNGGVVSNNIAGNGGGIENRGSFEMSSGIICNNQAQGTGSTGQGGGVRQWTGTFEMKGGSIQNNSAVTGAGVYNNGEGECKFTLQNGLIMSNQATGSAIGGGVTVVYAEFTMNGGMIYGNTAGTGAGVAVSGSNNGGSFLLNAGVITQNNATTNGGGVYISNQCVSVKMLGGSITGNTVPSNFSGGGVYLYAKDNSSSATFEVGGNINIQGNNIQNDISKENNVYVSNNTIITIISELANPIGISSSVEPGTEIAKGTDTYSLTYSDLEKMPFDTDNQVLVKDNNSFKLYTTQNVFKVTFNSNEGDSAQTKEQFVVKNVETALIANPFTRIGYAFTGWSTSQNGESGTNYADKANITISDNLTLYAQWEPKTATTISFSNSLELSKTYNGQAVSISEGDYTVTGDSREVTFAYQAKDENGEWQDMTSAPMNAGTYQVKAIVAEDDTYASAESDWKEFEISKAAPAYTVPAGLTATVGQTLADVILPEQENGTFTWQDAAATSVGTAGTKTFKVTYTPDDTNNYNIVNDIEVTVTVKAKDTQKPTTDDNKNQSGTNTDKNTTNTDKTTSNSAKTGDTANMTLWIAFVVLFGGLSAVTAGMRRKKK